MKITNQLASSKVANGQNIVSEPLWVSMIDYDLRSLPYRRPVCIGTDNELIMIFNIFYFLNFNFILEVLCRVPETSNGDLKNCPSYCNRNSTKVQRVKGVRDSDRDTTRTARAYGAVYSSFNLFHIITQMIRHDPSTENCLTTWSPISYHRSDFT